MLTSEILFFSGFIVFIVFMLALDLGIFNKTDHEMSYREATAWTCVWVIIALGAYYFLSVSGEMLHGIDSMEKLQTIVAKYKNDVRIIPGNYEASLEAYRKAISLEFLTGYLLEYSLSVDNIFVIMLIFSAFGVQKKLYHRVLLWGIIGAVIARMLFIYGGGFFISRFEWILYGFAAFLVFTGIKLFFSGSEDEKIDPENHIVVRICAKLFRVHKKFEGNKFFYRQNGKNYITPLFICLMVIEFTDVIFAVDSIPAIFGITKDTYIVFFSNIFAILGLRSMFFLLSNFMDKLKYFKHGLALLLIFIGAKMFLHNWLHEIGFTNVHSLLVILTILGCSVLLSLVYQKKANVR